VNKIISPSGWMTIGRSKCYRRCSSGPAVPNILPGRKINGKLFNDRFRPFLILLINTPLNGFKNVTNGNI